MLICSVYVDDKLWVQGYVEGSIDDPFEHTIEPYIANRDGFVCRCGMSNITFHHGYHISPESKITVKWEPINLAPKDPKEKKNA